MNRRSVFAFLGLAPIAAVAAPAHAADGGRADYYRKMVKGASGEASISPARPKPEMRIIRSASPGFTVEAKVDGVWMYVGHCPDLRSARLEVSAYRWFRDGMAEELSEADAGVAVV